MVLKASGFLNLKQKIYPFALGTQQKISNFTMMEQHSLVRIESLSPAVRSPSLVLMFTLCSSFRDEREKKKNEAQSPGAYANLGDAAPPLSIFIDSCFIYIYIFQLKIFYPLVWQSQQISQQQRMQGAASACIWSGCMCAFSILKLLFSPACTAGIFISVRAPLHIKVNNKHEEKYSVSSWRRYGTVVNIWI